MKNYLNDFLQTSEKLKHPEAELTKLTKPSSVSFVSGKDRSLTKNESGSVSFVSSELENVGKTNIAESENINSANIFQNVTDKTDRTPQVCPSCAAKLQSDDSPELIIRFCPLGCSFVWREFNDFRAATNLTAVMLVELPENEIKTMYYALDARRVALMKTGLDFYDANKQTEDELFPCWLDDFKLKNKIGTIGKHKKGEN